jgi:ribosomal protein S18 acetylase RimI-like enzyme
MELRILGPEDAGVLECCAEWVFDDPIDRPAVAEFLADPRHHLAAAIDEGVVVGFVSAVHTVHPDKERPELWINEVSVAPSHRRRGVAKRLLAVTLEAARELGCREAWVLTERANPAAMRLYASLGGVEEESDTVMFTFPLAGRGEEG